MNSENLFKYSDEFLNESIDDLIRLKFKKKTDVKNVDFENKLKSLLGKNINEEKIDQFINTSDKQLREEIIEKFEIAREERIKEIGKDQAMEIEKRIFLQSIDINWKSHIQYLESLRQVIGLRSYGQRDPLIEYKKEAFSLFENLLEKLKIDFVTLLFNLKIIKKEEEESKKLNDDIANNPKCLIIKKKGEKISRNDRCEATGKKYKNCCGAL